MSKANQFAKAIVDAWESRCEQIGIPFKAACVRAERILMDKNAATISHVAIARNVNAWKSQPSAALLLVDRLYQEIKTPVLIGDEGVRRLRRIVDGIEFRSFPLAVYQYIAIEEAIVALEQAIASIQ